MESVESFDNAEYGTSVSILKNTDTGKFHTILRDTDADEVVGVQICPTYDLAHKYALKWAGLTATN